jgi:hypothetical protein
VLDKQSFPGFEVIEAIVAERQRRYLDVTIHSCRANSVQRHKETFDRWLIRIVEGRLMSGDGRYGRRTKAMATGTGECQ